MHTRRHDSVTMQVVLPDLKDSNSDHIVWLSPGQACEAEEAAQNYGALAALHGVAGDRALHRILPSAYSDRWEWLNTEVKAQEHFA